MSEVVKLVKESTIRDIAEAIREKEGSINQIPVAEMAQRIKTLGSGIEYTTGEVTFSKDYDKKTIEHGLSKPPKLFFLYWNEYSSNTSTYLTFVCYTDKVAGVWCGDANKASLNSAYTTMVGYTTPTYGCVTVNDNTVDIAIVARQWQAGDWTWEAWTW